MRASNRANGLMMTVVFRPLAGVVLAIGALASLAAGGETPTLRAIASGKLVVGVAVSPSDLQDQPTAQLIASQFSSLTSTNDFKPDHLQPDPGHFSFETADRIAAFAREHQSVLIGHTLCWHQQTPKWMFQQADGKPLSREQALDNVRRHVSTVVAHFKGRVQGWEAVNEAVSDTADGPDLRDTPALRAIGEDYIEKVFRFAHEADPGAELYLTDFNIETPGKRERAVRLIQRLKAAGVRIDAVGIQGHWGMKYPRIGVIDDAIKAFKAEGVKVLITELDIDVFPYRKPTAGAKDLAPKDADPYHDGCPPEVLTDQATRYADLFKLFVRHHDAVSRVTFWGVHDGTSWLNNFPIHSRTNYPLLWDRQLVPKPAFNAVVEVLSGR